MSEALRTALREACAELREHNADEGHLTDDALIEAWERLADEAELIEAAQEPMVELTDEALATMLGVPVEMVAPGQPVGDRDVKPENLQVVQVQPDPTGGAGGAADAPRGFDRLQASLVAPTHLPSAEPPAPEPSAVIPALAQIEQIIRAQYEPPLPTPGHARMCCARLGGVWCTEPHGHAGPCLGPEEREIASGEYGPGRRR